MDKINRIIAMELIDKATVVAEIERLIEKAKAEKVLHPKTILAAKNYLLIEDYNELLSFLNTLEVKEMDLEKEIANYINKHYHIRFDETLEKGNDPLTTIDFEEIAKHFFELGFKAQKGE